METSYYDCPIIPNKRRCKGFIEFENPLLLDWDKYFNNIDKHPDGSFFIINTGECNIMILKTGYFDILHAENDDVINKYVNIIEKVVKNGIS